MLNKIAGWVALVAVALVPANSALAGKDIDPVKKRPKSPPVYLHNRCPSLYLGSYFPLCPGPTASMYPQNQYPYIEPTYRIIVPDRYFIDPSGLYKDRPWLHR